MLSYIARRIALIPLTLLGIIALNFAIVQVAPGGPVEQVLAKVKGLNNGGIARFNASRGDAGTSTHSTYRGAQGLDPEFVKEIEKQFGFDKPPLERFILMVKSYAVFDLGQSFYRTIDVMKLIGEKLPVSASLGLWSTL